MGEDVSSTVGTGAAILYVGVEPLSAILSEKIKMAGLSVIPLQDQQALEKVKKSSVLDCVDAILIADDSACDTFLSDLFAFLDEEAYQYVPVFRRIEEGSSQPNNEAWAHRYNNQFSPVEWENKMFVELDASITEYRRQRKFLHEIRQRSSAIGLIQSGCFQLQTPKQARNLTTMLSHVCPNPSHAALAMSELLLNAIEHGNLEVGYDDKSRLLAEGLWDEAIQERLLDPKFKHRKVVVDFKRFDGHVVLKIQDEGSGFDWRPFMEWVPGTRYDQLHGRGIFLVRSLTGVKLQFSDDGREVTIEMHV